MAQVLEKVVGEEFAVQAVIQWLSASSDDVNLVTFIQISFFLLYNIDLNMHGAIAAVNTAALAFKNDYCGGK